MVVEEVVKGAGRNAEVELEPKKSRVGSTGEGKPREVDQKVERTVTSSVVGLVGPAGGWGLSKSSFPLGAAN